MQKFLVLLFFFPAITNLQAQILPNFDGFKLEKASDYKIAEPIVLQAANYLLATAYDKDNSGQKDALKNVIQWMSGTPDYAFRIDKITEYVTQGNNLLLGYYLTAMTKFVLENKSLVQDPKVVMLNSTRILLAYTGNPDHKMKPSKHLKKLAEADAQSQLEKELGY